MRDIGTQEIETDRLLLRRFTLNDTYAMYNNWAGEEEVTSHLPWNSHKSMEETGRYILQVCQTYQNPDFYHWAIVPDDLGEPVGSISAVGKDDRIAMVHIGYVLGKKWWHQGYMSEALAPGIEFFFTEVGISRVESQHDPNNPNSGGVMKKCGMVYEGTKRQADFSNKGIVDACMHSILRSEWRCDK